MKLNILLSYICNIIALILFIIDYICGETTQPTGYVIFWIIVSIANLSTNNK